jgi:16S rRNA (adenine1518-N6/adenine1519-N6)-dimethyltransferase
VAEFAGGSEAASRAVTAAGVDPTARGEQLDVAALARIATHLPAEALLHRGAPAAPGPATPSDGPGTVGA